MEVVEENLVDMLEMDQEVMEVVIVQEFLMDKMLQLTAQEEEEEGLGLGLGLILTLVVMVAMVLLSYGIKNNFNSLL